MVVRRPEQQSIAWQRALEPAFAEARARRSLVLLDAFHPG
jgi:hypothetical protein